jgi:molybdate transport system substrate-binding protein
MALSILSTLALRGVLDRFKAELEKSLSTRLDIRYDATQAILKQLEAAQKDAWPDALILTREAIQQLEQAGRVSTTQVLGSSGVGVAVRKGAPRPDISTPEAFKRAIANASSVAHSQVGASGLYFASLIDSVPLKVRKRVVVEKGPVGRVVASGEAEIGVQQICELAPVPGIEIVGGLPEPLQRITHFAAGIPVHAANPQGASALMQQLLSGRIRDGMAEGGIDPA